VIRRLATKIINSLGEIFYGVKFTELITEEYQCQKAWDKVSEFMNSQTELSFLVTPWNQKGEPKYSLQTVISNSGNFGSYKWYFESNKEWIK
jgi:hypothetical protein